MKVRAHRASHRRISYPSRPGIATVSRNSPSALNSLISVDTVPLRQAPLQDAELLEGPHGRPHQGDPRTQRAPHRLALDDLDVDALALERDRQRGAGDSAAHDEGTLDHGTHDTLAIAHGFASAGVTGSRAGAAGGNASRKLSGIGELRKKSL